MKLASLLFFSTLVAFFVTDYLVFVVPKAVYHAQGAEHPEVKAYLNDINETVDATDGPPVKKVLSAGYLRRVDIAPGFRVVHDPALGDELIVSGPAAALEFFEMHEDKDRLSPDFSRPVRLKDLVEIRVNLHKHHSEQMRINLLYAPEGRTELQPDFVTEGPLKFKLLTFAGVPPHAVRVESKDVVINTTNDVSGLEGTAERLEFIFDDKSAPEQNTPGLRAGKTYRTYVGND